MNPEETDVEATEMIEVSVTVPMICRTCHEEISHEQLLAQTDVFRPCYCREPIHRTCLETWLDAQCVNDDDNYKKRCEVCLYEYKYRQVPPGYRRASCPEFFGQYMVPTVTYTLLTLLIPLIWRFELSFLFYIGVNCFDDESDAGAGFFVGGVFSLMIYLSCGAFIPLFYKSLFKGDFETGDEPFHHLNKLSMFQKYLFATGILLLEFLAHLIGWIIVQYNLLPTGKLPDDPIFEGLSYLTFILGLLVLVAFLIFCLIGYLIFNWLRTASRVKMDAGVVDTDDDAETADVVYRWATVKEFFSHNLTVSWLTSLIVFWAPILWRLDLIWPGSVAQYINNKLVSDAAFVIPQCIGAAGYLTITTIVILAMVKQLRYGSDLSIRTRYLHLAKITGAFLGFHIGGLALIHAVFIPLEILGNADAFYGPSLFTFSIGAVVTLVVVLVIGVLAVIGYGCYKTCSSIYRYCCRVPDGPGRVEIVPIDDGNDMV